MTCRLGLATGAGSNCTREAALAVAVPEMAIRRAGGANGRIATGGSPVLDRPLRDLVRIRRLLQAAPRAAQALEVPRAPRQMAPKVDDAEVENAQLLRDVGVDLALGEDGEVFLLVDPDDAVAAPVEPVPEVLPDAAEDGPRTHRDGERPHAGLPVVDGDAPAHVVGVAERDAHERGELHVVVAAEPRLAALVRLQDAPPHVAAPLAEPRVLLLAELGALLGARDVVVALLDDPHAVGHHRLRAEEGLLVVDQVPPLEPAVQVVLVVVDALPDRLR